MEDSLGLLFVHLAQRLVRVKSMVWCKDFRVDKLEFKKWLRYFLAV